MCPQSVGAALAAALGQPQGLPRRFRATQLCETAVSAKQPQFLRAFSALGEDKKDFILQARARILQSRVENGRFEEQVEEKSELSQRAQAALDFAQEAVELAKHTQNRRLLTRAHIAQGFVLANDFFSDPKPPANLATGRAPCSSRKARTTSGRTCNCCEGNCSRREAPTPCCANGRRGSWAIRHSKRSARSLQRL